MTVPVEFNDAINAKILEVSEDRVQGFQRDPLGEIARLSGVDLPVVIERIHAMLRAGNIRRVRQTLLATNLAQGALVAWQVPETKLNAAFDWIAEFYASTPLGPVMLTDIVGISRGAGVAIIGVTAVLGFTIAARIEGTRS